MLRRSLLTILIVAMVSCSPRPDVPTEFQGVVATLECLGAATVSDRPLRLQHTLKNTSRRAVLLYDLDSSVLPRFQGEWACSANGPSGPMPPITLESGQTVSRWVELTLGQPDEHWSCRIDVRCQGTGIGYAFVSRTVPRTVRFHMGYDDKIFEGETDGVFAPVLATPWLEIELGEGSTLNSYT